MATRPKLELLSDDEFERLHKKSDEEIAARLTLQEEERFKAMQAQEKKDAQLAAQLAAKVTVIEIPSDSDEERPVKVKQESPTAKSTPPILAKRAHSETPSSKSALAASDDSSSSSAVRHSAKEKRAYRKYKRQREIKKERRAMHRKDDGKIRKRDGKKNKPDETPKRARTSVPPPPSVSPPIPPPPSVAPPPAAASPPPPPPPAAASKNPRLGAKRGPKPKHKWTIDEYVHMAKTMSAPRFETPTVALRTLHRGHLLGDVTSVSMLRNAWKQLCEGVTSPLHDPRMARALGATEEQLEELRKQVHAYERQQIVQQENADQPVEPLIAQQMEERAAKEKEARKEAKEARGETVGKALLKASQELVKATKDAMTMYAQLHAIALERVEDTYGHLSSSEDEDSEDSIFTE